MGDHLRPSLKTVLDGLDGPLRRSQVPVPSALAVIEAGNGKARNPRLHFGILTDATKFDPCGMVHVTRGLGAVVEEAWDPGWQRMTRGFFLLRGAS